MRSLGKSVGFRFRAATPEGFPRLEALAPEKVAAATSGLFSMIRAFNDEIKGYDAQLEQLCVTFPAVQRIRQVNGVGPVTALAFVLTLDAADRFADGRSAAAYLGLLPCRDQSGKSDKQLRISKTGNDFVRRNLVQCTQYILGPFGVDSDPRRWGRAKMESGGRNGNKRIVVATARKLAVLLFKLWKSGETWEPLYNAKNLSTPNGVVSSAERPDSADSSASAGPPDAVVPHERRAVDWSTPGGQDSILLRGPSVPIESADRSVGPGTTARKPKEK